MFRKYKVLSLAPILLLFMMAASYFTGSAMAEDSPLKVGWVIGSDESNTAVILHTGNGGKKWVVQGDTARWEGHIGNDISAVDKHTVWAALAGDYYTGADGIILHTTNGGRTWTEQTLPDGVDGIKGIRGLTRHEAWAVSVTGTILHTTDGGEVWTIVDSGIEIGQVNGMDAIGYRDVRDADRSGINTGKINANVWIVDIRSGPLGMIHSLYNGDIWRQENLPNADSEVHMVSAYSPRVVWASAWNEGYLYRTADGGENWESVGEVGPNDIDDMCAYSATALWFVQYQGASNGFIYHAHLEETEFFSKQFQPVAGYNYEGLTCVNDQAAVVVGYTRFDDPPLTRGIILATNDGGETWEYQPVPVDDAWFWKVSFVGAHR